MVPAYAAFRVASDKPRINNPPFAFPKVWGLTEILDTEPFEWARQEVVGFLMSSFDACDSVGLGRQEGTQDVQSLVLALFPPVEAAAWTVQARTSPPLPPPATWTDTQRLPRLRPPAGPCVPRGKLTREDQEAPDLKGGQWVTSEPILRSRLSTWSVGARHPALLLGRFKSG